MKKATGIVRRVDELGRIVLPIELRRVLGIQEKDKLEIYTEGDTIILHKYAPGCVFCGDTDVRICERCAGEAIRAFGGEW
jgi:transcriptional pleiotropic regulator of transition state genes